MGLGARLQPYIHISKCCLCSGRYLSPSRDLATSRSREIWVCVCKYRLRAMLFNFHHLRCLLLNVSVQTFSLRVPQRFSEHRVESTNILLICSICSSSLISEQCLEFGKSFTWGVSKFQRNPWSYHHHIPT